MATSQIRKYPDHILTQRATTTTLAEGQAVAAKLIATANGLNWGECLGLAAPQIGVLQRVFLALGVIYINPEVKWTPTGQYRLHNEGCYSLEDERYNYQVKRPYAVILKWMDMNGDDHEERFTGQAAQVILHEYDHLEGKLCNNQENNNDK